MTSPSADRPTVASLDKRVTRTEDKIVSHERECALRYESLEAGIHAVGKRFDEGVNGLLDVIGRKDGEGLRGSVSDLKADKQKRAGVWAALVTVGAIAGTALGLVIPVLMQLLF